MRSISNCAGIYRIVVARGDKPPKYYIGQASLLRKRSDAHFSALKRGKHKNELLQRAFVKYGITAFCFEVLVVCEQNKEILDLFEQRVLDNYAPETCYNMSRTCVGSRLGIKHRPETIAKIAAAAKGRKPAQSTIDAVRRSSTGRTHSEETRAKRSAALLGNRHALGHKQTDEHKEKVGAFFRGRKKPPEEIARTLETRRANAAARGYWMPPEAIARAAFANRGKKHSPEHCAKIARASLGRKHSEEALAKMSASQKGRIVSPEARAKISAALTGKKHTPERCAAKSRRMLGKPFRRAGVAGEGVSDGGNSGRSEAVHCAGRNRAEAVQA